MELNRKLRYVNEHQQCTLDAYQRDLEECRRELVETRVQLARKEREDGSGGGGELTRARSTEQELRMVC